MNRRLFQERLRSKLAQKRISQTKLGWVFSKPVHRTTVSRWLTDSETTEPSVDQMLEMSRALGVSMLWLAGLIDTEAPPSYLKDDERKLVAEYRGLSQSAREAALAIIHSMKRDL